MRKFFRRLDIRAGLIAFCLVGLILSVEVYFSFGKSRVETLEDFTKDSQMLTDTAANSMAFPLWDFDIEILDNMKDALISNEHVVAVTIKEKNGSVIAQKNAADFAGVETLQLTSTIPAPDDGELGTLKINYELDGLKQQLRAAFFVSVLRALIVSLLVFAVIAWTIRSLAKPVQALLQSVKGYDGRTRIKSIPGAERHDELGSLARGFGHMAHQIFDNVATLESNVAQRTQELSEALEKVEAASQAKSSFLANMSHEIRTPMNGVLGMAQVLQNTELNEMQKSFVKTINDSGFALVTIINDILDYSKIEAGKVELELSPFNLSHAVDDVAMLLGVTAREKNLDLLVKVQPELNCDLVGDAGRVRQILTNLVGNAIKFTSEGSVVIDISGERAGDAFNLKIKVSDTGIGLQADKTEVIFEEFNQAENSTTRKFGGTGLGLAITHSLVEAMEGEISVESIYGKGSDFIVNITLPIAPEQTITQDVFKFSEQRVLVIDDNQINRDILEQALTGWNLKPIFAASAKEALIALKNAYQNTIKIDLIITDYHMPEHDGLSLVSAIRKLKPFAGVKVMALTSTDDDTVIRQFKSLGVEDVFAKPVKLDVLNQCLHNSLLEQNVKDLQNIAQYATSQLKPKEDRSPENEGEAASKPYILVVDDIQTNRDVLGYMIDQKEYGIDFAEDGVVAFERAKQREYALIFMDISMPRMDGEEATDAIRTYEKMRGKTPVPIIALTAHAMKGDRERLLSQGMNDYIAKPVQQSEVIDVLSKWVRPSQLANISKAS